MVPEIHIEDYKYALEDDRIAKYPLPERDASKLLLYRNGKVEEHIFRELPSLLPENALMVFNDTKVVPARLHFQRSSGAHIEIFCLEPVNPVEYNLAFASTGESSWKCIIGNVKKWKEDVLHLYNPADDKISSYFEQNGLEMESDRLNAEKTTYFLRLIVMLVMVIGLIISTLSFYILMLSIYLLVQKNTEKLQNLLLIGYRRARVALPYQLLTMGLNVIVLAIAIIAVVLIRNYYMTTIQALYPEIAHGSMTHAIELGLILFLIVTILNAIIIRRKINKI